LPTPSSNSLREIPAHGVINFYCRGGAGLFMTAKAESVRNAAFDLKRQQVEATGAESVVTPLSSCCINLTAGAPRMQCRTSIESLITLVAVNLKMIEL
jgi:Fe-S oxidoreductase